uniref:SKICH domain-containing protein n=1 Tax=Astyanax mexicanus TaxID=7994 RepID=A0A8B9HUH1_ASTMX
MRNIVSFEIKVMETSNFAHVIFQNVGKSFLPQAALECHYTLTPFITPHPKDWVGIFKVSTFDSLTLKKHHNTIHVT